MDKLALYVSVWITLHLCLLEQSASQAPSLRQSLSSSYTINPSASPYFPYCKFNGSPPPAVSWSFNGQRLPTEGSQGGPYYVPGTGVLVLSGGVSGTYTCTGTNQFGSDRESVTITIVTKQSTPWYLRPYMWFVFAAGLWVICVVLMVALFIHKKNKAKNADVMDFNSVPPVYYNASSDEVRLGGRPGTPSTWDQMPSGNKVLCFDLQPGCPEYQLVLDAFNKTMTRGRNYTEIITIQRVQNSDLYRQYYLKKESMDVAYLHVPTCQNERQLFHGTDSESAKKINANGFNRSYAGKNAKAYGVGTYFARDASYSANSTYSKPDSHGRKHMYYARVLVGEYTVGNSSMTVPPPKNPQLDPHTLFDSLVDNSQNPSIFVVGPDAQSYPEYLIIFK